MFLIYVYLTTYPTYLPTYLPRYSRTQELPLIRTRHFVLSCRRAHARTHACTLISIYRTVFAPLHRPGSGKGGKKHLRRGGWVSWVLSTGRRRGWICAFLLGGGSSFFCFLFFCWFWFFSSENMGLPLEDWNWYIRRRGGSTRYFVDKFASKDKDEDG